MPRDALNAMRTTIAHGPNYCPPDLFAGEARRVLMGLKAHANTIAHARHVALEETFPRTRALLGDDVFHALAERHLDDPATLARPLARIGERFATLAAGAARDLARLEWAWLEAHGAAEGPPFDLAALHGRDSAAIAGAVVAPHPAARLVILDHAVPWDGATLPDVALVTRPHTEINVHAIGPADACLFASHSRPTPFAEWLEQDADAAIRLVTLGALTEDRPE